MKVITISDIQQLVQTVGLKPFFNSVIDYLQQDFSRWDQFQFSPRYAAHYPHGVIELMPCSDEQLFSYKLVNGHPGNPLKGDLSVVALGQLIEVSNGYPILLSEMTLLTAIRTAAVAALGARYMARDDCDSLAIIGTGAQAEFQVIAMSCVRPIKTVYCYDVDNEAMDKFSSNLNPLGFDLVRCDSVAEAIANTHLVITATAAKTTQRIATFEQFQAGSHIHAMGGDCPGKTEIDLDMLHRARVVVEYLPQSLIEGEIQQGDASLVHAELWQLVNGTKQGREDDNEITLFDSVGFALEDYSILRLVHDLTEQHQLGQEMDLIPELKDPKNLFSLLG